MAPPLAVSSGPLLLSLLRQTDDSPGTSGGNTSSTSSDNSEQILIIAAVLAAILVLCLLLFFIRLILWRRRVGRAPQRSPEDMEAALAETGILRTELPVRGDARMTERERLVFGYFPQQAPSVVRMQRLVQHSGLSVEEFNAVAPVRPFQKCKDDPERANSERCGEDDICAVCLEEMETDSKTRRLPCGHEFHAKCIEDWVTKANRCPVCNTSVVNEETLQKNRTAVLEGRDVSANGARQRRRRTRGENGTFELRQNAPENTPESDQTPPPGIVN